MKDLVIEAKFYGLNQIGITTSEPSLEILAGGSSLISAPVRDLVDTYSTALESQLAAEVIG